MTKMKPKLAIYDLTDCEGCEVQLVSLLDKFLELEKRIDIVNWRLGQEEKESGPFDICLIEGTPISGSEQTLLKALRKKSQILVALGACAVTGGVPAMIEKKQRKALYRKIYGAKYQPRGIDSLPLSSYVKVDFNIPGCPADKQDILRVLTDLLAGKPPKAIPYPVCLECKAAGNSCRLLEDKPCLGPITQAGCEATCVTGGTGCYGCRGVVEGANIKPLAKKLRQFMTPEEIEKFSSVFLKASQEYNEIKKQLK